MLTSTCQVPSTAKAYSLNYTVVPKEPLGFLTTFPLTGQSRPGVSTLNAPTAVTANAAIVPAGDNGDVSVFVTNDTELIIDINGYFAPPASGGLSLYNLAPCRVYDCAPKLERSLSSTAWASMSQAAVVMPLPMRNLISSTRPSFPPTRCRS